MRTAQDGHFRLMWKNYFVTNNKLEKVLGLIFQDVPSWHNDCSLQFESLINSHGLMFSCQKVAVISYLSHTVID